MNGFWVLSWHKWDDLYVRAHNNLLKWKYAHMSSDALRPVLFSSLSFIFLCAWKERKGQGAWKKWGFFREVGWFREH
jgi:hypothetical protein